MDKRTPKLEKIGCYTYGTGYFPNGGFTFFEKIKLKDNDVLIYNKGILFKLSGSGKGAAGVYSQTSRGNEVTVGDKGKQVYGCPALKLDTPPEKPEEKSD